MILQISGRMLSCDDAKWVHRFVPHDSLFNGRQALQWRLKKSRTICIHDGDLCTHQQRVDVVLASDQRSEGAKLLSQGQKDLILIVDGVGQERNELHTSPLYAQRKGDRTQLLDAV